MTDKVQKIREEVERLYNQSLADEKRQVERGLECVANVSYGKSKACKELLSFINSMQEETVSEDLEKEIQDYYNSRREYSGRYNAVIPVYRHQLIDIARHFANWQKQQIKKAIDLGEPPYLISVEQAYYRTLKLLEE